jgi:hypothetical protein
LTDIPNGNNMGLVEYAVMRDAVICRKAVYGFRLMEANTRGDDTCGNVTAKLIEQLAQPFTQSFVAKVGKFIIIEIKHAVRPAFQIA